MPSKNKNLVLLLGSIMSLSWISQSLMDLAIVILLGLFIIQNRSTLQNDLKQIFRFKLLLFAMTAYFASAIASYFVNADPAYEAFTNLSKFVWVFQWLLFAVAAEKIDWELIFGERLTQVFQFFTWATFIPVICGFNIFIFEGFDIIFYQATNYRIIGLVNSATYHGLIGGLIFIFLLPIAICNWKKLSLNNKINYGILLVLIFLSTVLTMTRGVWLSLTAAIFLLMYLLNYKKVFFSIIGLALFSGLVLQGPIKDFIKHRSNSDGCRLKLLNAHVNMFKQYPFLGAGYRDNLRDLKPFWPKSEIGLCRHLRDDGNHAHNQYLNVLATTGLIGFFFFMLFHGLFFMATYKLTRFYQKNPVLFPLSISLLGMQTFFLVSNITETSFEYGKVRTILLLVWAAVFALSLKMLKAKNKI